MMAGTKSNKIGKMSPVGDLGKKDNAEFDRFFTRKIKNAGIEPVVSRIIPVKAFQKDGGDNSL